jgi:hypothetical protein
MKREYDRASDAHLFGGFLHTLAIDPGVTGLDHGLGQGSALHQTDKVQETVDPQLNRHPELVSGSISPLAARSPEWMLKQVQHDGWEVSSLQFRKFGEGVGRRAAPVLARRPPATPTPGIAGLGEADIAHQFRDRIIVETDRGRELEIDRIVAPCRPHLAGVARETVGKIDPNPGSAEPPVGQIGPARIGLGSESCGVGGRKLGHCLSAPDGEESRAPALCYGFQQRHEIDVERPEADLKPVHGAAIGLLEVRNRAEDRLAWKDPASIGQHRGERANAR